MKSFLCDQDFLLTTPTAEALFHQVAAKMPIVDYHCHIPAAQILADTHFANLTEAWLGGDHYKWRLMRSCGVDERLITGDAPARQKFQAWAETLPKCIGNPVYEWSHLELKRYFGYDGVLGPETADEIWELGQQVLSRPDMGCRGLVRRSGVKLLCTTDDPADLLEDHIRLAAEPDLGFKVVPALRPDAAMKVEAPGFAAYVRRVEALVGRPLATAADFFSAMEERYDFFDQMGCRAADHAWDQVDFVTPEPAAVNRAFAAAISGESVPAEDATAWKSGYMLFSAAECAKRGWVMQLHMACTRNVNTRMFELLGADTGFDSIDVALDVRRLGCFLDACNQRQSLPKTILYSLNPADNAALDTLIGCFQEGPVAGKLQNGSAWWFNDHEEGMRAQMQTLAADGVLGTFVGMLTDSRSFLSYPRHEYFRRILCSVLGEWVEAGRYPDDKNTLGRLVRDISYNNAVRYFGFDLPIVDGAGADVPADVDAPTGVAAEAGA